MNFKVDLQKNKYINFIKDSINKEIVEEEYKDISLEFKKNDKLNKYKVLSKEEKQIIFNISESNLELREELLKIMYLINQIKFLTPDMLSIIYSPNRSFEENNYNLLQLSSIFGGPLNKKTYSVLGSKYVYTNKKDILSNEVLNSYNKASYILCKLHSSNANIKIIDINTELKRIHNNIYTIIKVSLFCNKDIRYVYIISNIDSYMYFKSTYSGIFLNIERVGEILNKIDIINDLLINGNLEKTKELSEKALFIYNIN